MIQIPKQSYADRTETEYSGLGDCRQCLYTNKFLLFSDDTSSGIAEI
jgi:hypothetical protein